MGKVLPSQRLLKQFEEQLVFVEMNLSEIVRSGAQMMLQYALEREGDGGVGSKLLMRTHRQRRRRRDDATGMSRIGSSRARER